MRSVRRALPGPIIDLIRDGVEHPGKNTKKTYAAAVRTAMSAQQRGWGFPDWEALMMEPASTLGLQMAIQRAQYRRSLREAWEHAARRITESPPMTRDDARDFLDDTEMALIEDRNLDFADRVVVQHVLDRGRELGTKRVALPWRQVSTETGLTEAVVKRVLRTKARGYLELAERGRQGLHGRASLYWVRHPTSPVPGRCVGGSGHAA